MTTSILDRDRESRRVHGVWIRAATHARIQRVDCSDVLRTQREVENFEVLGKRCACLSRQAELHTPCTASRARALLLLSYVHEDSAGEGTWPALWAFRSRLKRLGILATTKSNVASTLRDIQ